MATPGINTTPPLHMSLSLTHTRPILTMEQPFFPEEIWEKVFSHFLPVDCDGHEVCLDELLEDGEWIKEYLARPSPDLLNVSRTSKKFHRIADSLIYRNIIVGKGFTRMRLITTLIEQPALRQHVRSLFNFEGYWYPEPTAEDLGTAYRAFLGAQSELGLTPKLREAFARGLQHAEDVQAQQLLLVALCPRLEQLDLRCAFGTELAREVLREVLKVCELPGKQAEGLLTTGHLSRLRKLRLIPVAGIPFSLPNLTTLVLKGGCGTPKQELGPIPKELELQHLNLVDPYLSQANLQQLLCRYPKLRLLQVKLSSSSEHSGTTILQLGVALRGYGNYGNPSLESLIIDNDGSRMMGRGQIGSLLPLCNLKRLSLSLEDLVGDIWNRWIEEGIVGNDASPLKLDEELPDSLETLEVQCHWKGSQFDPLMSYLHYEVFSLISNGWPANLRRILLQHYTNGPTLLSYTKNDGHPGWTLTIYESEEEMPVYDILDACPMVEGGYLSVEYGTHVADTEPTVDGLW
ncbi:hypothetical protein F4820DRAFT_467801 [Hypoxylon rubiginosum]|uniref:Uncharacterized protein n=1 Tax=Hypoxylon rubiginosum TaxID=110542 RepID=A0ACB9YHD0_9PEZI|nr:hypothetical protein F4820DRAFT_467801 [Hypoxylon rubiginosum]